MNVRDPVLVVVAISEPEPFDILSFQAVRYRIRKATVSSTTLNGVPYAMLRPLGPDIPFLLHPEYEGVTWCRGWAREDRDALWAAWTLAVST